MLPMVGSLLQVTFCCTMAAWTCPWCRHNNDDPESQVVLEPLDGYTEARGLVCDQCKIVLETDEWDKIKNLYSYHWPVARAPKPCTRLQLIMTT